jgi:acyl carrier protein
MSVQGSWLKELVEEVVRENSPLGAAAEFSEDTNLIRQGIVDSLAIFMIVARLEERLGREIKESAIHPDAFRTIATIVALLEKLGFAPELAEADTVPKPV